MTPRDYVMPFPRTGLERVENPRCPECGLQMGYHLGTHDWRCSCGCRVPEAEMFDRPPRLPIH